MGVPHRVLRLIPAELPRPVFSPEGFGAGVLRPHPRTVRHRPRYSRRASVAPSCRRPHNASQTENCRLMALNARERALALVSVLGPNDLVPCRLLAELLAEVEPPPSAPLSPPHPDGWTTNALAAHYECGPSTMRARIEGGEFGIPESVGGPSKAGRKGWIVPHQQVLARDARVQGVDVPEATAARVAVPDTPPAVPSRDDSQSKAARRSREAHRRGAVPTLAEARRQRRSVQ